MRSKRWTAYSKQKSRRARYTSLTIRWQRLKRKSSKLSVPRGQPSKLRPQIRKVRIQTCRHKKLDDYCGVTGNRHCQQCNEGRNDCVVSTATTSLRSPITRHPLSQLARERLLETQNKES